MLSQTKRLMGTLVNYKELMMMYTCAMKEIQTKFEVLNTEFKVRYQRNPISAITTRLKKTSSITEKLARQGEAFSLENIEGKLSDVAGVRVICSYIDDIYTIAEALLRQDDITLVTRKDYIANPKPNGYRSLHLIVKVPVFFADQKKEMKVEVQIRTIAMDFWASLEHQLKYKQEVPDQQRLVAELKECADVIHATDQRMLAIRGDIERVTTAPTEEDILFEKLSKFDISID
ncbi:MAG: GTP pyrophosphokinase family protein [Eubacteriales bacterium]|nr:GTP pyrophosphokinase family protein [Eubacteriales bacterium]